MSKVEMFTKQLAALQDQRKNHLPKEIEDKKAMIKSGGLNFEDKAIWEADLAFSEERLKHLPEAITELEAVIDSLKQSESFERQ